MLKPERRRTDLIAHSLELATAECNAKKLHREIRNLVRLIENDRFRAGQELDESLLFHCEIGQQQMVIDHNEIGFLGGSARFHDVALRVLGTFLPETVIDGRRDERPDRRILGNLNQFRAITARGAMPPTAYGIEIGSNTRSRLGRLIEALQAEIIGSAL